MDGELTRLREAIADVDRVLLELIRRRMELSASVGRVKAASGLPVVMLDAEDRVLTRARDQADACGVTEEVMEEIFRAILRGSVERQHRVGMEERVLRGGKVLILGGGGGMGRWFQRFLSLVGHRVDLLDPVWADLPVERGRFARLDQLPSIREYDFILLAAPLAVTPSVLQELLSARPPGVVVEIASIKSHLKGVLDQAEAGGVRVASLHPMFGPSKGPYEPLTFVLACRQDPESERKRVAPLLRHPFTRVVAIPFDHHDRLMGWLLGLAHLNGMLFGAALASSELEPEELRICASTTFTRQAATARSVLAEDPQLYFDIQRLNPHREAVYQAARENLDRLITLVEQGDVEGFRALLSEARQAVTGES